MRGRRTSGLAVVAVLLAAAPAHAADRFVSSSGSDANACTQGAPCLTVQKGLDVAAASGDRVVIGPGTFTGHATTTKNVTVVGAGSGATTLAGDDGNPTLTLQGGGSVSALLIRADTGAGLELSSTSAATPALTYAVSAVNIEGRSGCSGVCLSSALVVTPDAGAPTRSITATIDHVDAAAGSGFGIGASGANVAATLRNVTVSTGTGAGQGIFFGNGADGSVADATITGTGNGLEAAGVNIPPNPANVTIARTRVDVGGEALFNVISKATVSDSLLISRTGGAIVVQGLSNGPGTDLVLRNSTVYAAGTTGTRALQLFQSAGTAAPTAELTNTIVRAVQPAGGMPAADIEAHGALAKVTAAHSSFTTTLLTGGAPASAIPVAGAGTNLSGDPGLVSPAGTDFHLLGSSPLIDKGDPAAVTAGETDLAGGARSLDGNADCTVAPDVGAFEAPTRVPIRACSPGGGGHGSDHTPPTLSGLRFSPATFRVVPKPRKPHRAHGKPRRAVSASAKRHRKPRAHRRGSHLKAKLSEAGTLTVTIRRCANRRCTRTKAAGTLHFTVKAGSNSLAFTGRIGRKGLRAGRYRVSVVATDAAGNRSAASSASFTIVKR